MTEEEIQLLIDMDIAVWEQYLPYLSAQIQQQVALGVFTGLTRNQIIANLDAAALSPTQIATHIRTSLNNYSRSVTSAIMEEEPDDTLYEYIGPIDGKTRDICLGFAREGRIRQSQIQKLRGGEESLVYGGGYNCRHKWQSVSKAGAKLGKANTKKAKELLNDR